MAETSGFFDAEFNEGTQEYDLVYLSSQFASYFSLFVKSGVFGSPTNQLKVTGGAGMMVNVAPGWAFIKGYWYNLDESMSLPVPSNASASSRVDSVICRWDSAARKISVIYQAGSTRLVRDGSYYDLQLAEIIVPAGASVVLSSNITDMRTNESVCGFVTNLLKIQTTEDLFSQYQAMFDEWFDSVKEQVEGDLGVQLQTEIGNLSSLSTTNKSSLVNAVNEVNNSVAGIKSGSVKVGKASTADSATQADSATNATTANSANTATSATTADKLKTPRKINGVDFDGTEDITVIDSSKPTIIYSTTEPVSVPENTIVFVYEE